MRAKYLAAVAAVSLIAGAAVAQTAQPLSLGNSPAARASADTLGESSLNRRRGVGIYIIGAVVLGLIVWGIIELTKGNDTAMPNSP